MVGRSARRKMRKRVLLEGGRVELQRRLMAAVRREGERRLRSARQKRKSSVEKRKEEDQETDLRKRISTSVVPISSRTSSSSPSSLS